MAGVLIRALRKGQAVYRDTKGDDGDVGAVREAVQQELERELTRQKALDQADRALFEVDYVALTDLEDMASITGPGSGPIGRDKGAVLSLAVKMLPVEEPGDEQERGQGVVRLIDNVVLEEGRK